MEKGPKNFNERNEQDILAELKEIRKEKYKEDMDQTHEKINVFIEGLGKSREELSKIELYHLLVGSSMSTEDRVGSVPDLPNGEIENFIRNDL